jgi:hypothetical protein
MTTFVSVPAKAIEDFCAARGFVRTVQRQEVVYVRRSRENPDVQIKVYTSVRVGGGTRRCGEDSIKVCAVFDNGRKSFGICKLPRVHRTGSAEKVLTRVLSRIKDAAARANQWIAANGGGASRAMRERLEEKAAFAEQERLQEEKAFLTGP